MFLKLSQNTTCNSLISENGAIGYAHKYINMAKKSVINSGKSRPGAFLCGNAGIFAVSAVISSKCQNAARMEADLENFCLEYNNARATEPNEILVGKAGYLSGAYWIEEQLGSNPQSSKNQISELCTRLIEKGRTYAKNHNSPLPLLFDYHEKEYLGAAHGLSGILLMILKSPAFKKPGSNFGNNSHKYVKYVKHSIDGFLKLQNSSGNFPSKLGKNDAPLIHWCHGAPGAVYLFAKSYLIFDDIKYLSACERCANLCWKRGLLKKGPGLCHGVAGNGYVFLLMYRLTHEPKYLYRAYKFMEFLSDKEFLKGATTPDRAYSLFEGIAGTVCFLLDLLEPKNAEFPFFNIFDEN